MGTFKITYYWPGEDQYGDTIARPCKDKHKSIQGHTIAVDPAVIPYGTKVLINNNIYVAEDCGGDVKGNVIDIYVDSPKQESYKEEIYIKK